MDVVCLGVTGGETDYFLGKLNLSEEAAPANIWILEIALRKDMAGVSHYRVSTEDHQAWVCKKRVIICRRFEASVVKEPTLLSVKYCSFFALACRQSPDFLETEYVKFMEFVDEHVCQTFMWLQCSMVAWWKSWDQLAVESKYPDLTTLWGRSKIYFFSHSFVDGYTLTHLR